MELSGTVGDTTDLSTSESFKCDLAWQLGKYRTRLQELLAADLSIYGDESKFPETVRACHSVLSARIEDYQTALDGGIPTKRTPVVNIDAEKALSGPDEEYLAWLKLYASSVETDAQIWVAEPLPEPIWNDQERLHAQAESCRAAWVSAHPPESPDAKGDRPMRPAAADGGDAAAQGMDVHPGIPCPDCAGTGKVVSSVATKSLGPGGPSLETRACWVCEGTGVGIKADIQDFLGYFGEKPVSKETIF